MKRILCALLALGFAAQADDAEAPALTLPSEPEVTPYFDMDLLSISGAWMKGVNSALSVDDLLGTMLSAGQSFGETEDYYHTWFARTGYLFGKRTHLTDEYNSNKPQIYPGSYRYEQNIIPVEVGYTFHYKWTEQFSTYIGAHAGFHYSSTMKKVKIKYENYYSQGYDTPLISKRGHTQFSPTIGAELGFVFKFNKRFSWFVSASLNNSFDIVKEDATIQSNITKGDAIIATFHTGLLITF